MQGFAGALTPCPSHAAPFLHSPAAAHARHSAKLLLPHCSIRGSQSALCRAPTSPVVSRPGGGLSIRVKQQMRVASGCSAVRSATAAPPASLLGWEPPLWMGICSLLPVIIWGATWVCTVGALHGAWASLWACTYLAATAWADIAPGSPPGTVDYTDMALRSIYGKQQFDPLGILHAPPHHQYSTSGQPWALDARIVRTLLPLAHLGWVAGRSVATGSGALPAVAHVSLMAASAIFLAVQTPVGAILAAVGRALKQLLVSCSALVKHVSKRTRGDEGAAVAQGRSMEDGSSKMEGPGSSSSSSSGSGSNSSGVMTAGSNVGSKMAAAPVGDRVLNALESTTAAAAAATEKTPQGADGDARPPAASLVAPPSSNEDIHVDLDNSPLVPASLFRTAACLGLVALSTYIAASETAVPLMTGEWATQPVTLLFVAAIVVGDLALPAAVAAAAVATAVVGLWQSFWSSRGSSTSFRGSQGSSTRGIGRQSSDSVDDVDGITPHRSSGDGNRRLGSSRSSSSSSRGASSNSREGGEDRESEQSSSSPSSPGHIRSSGNASSSLGSSPLDNPSQLGQPSGSVGAYRHPAWLSRLLLAIYATRGALDVALTVAVAMGWLSGHVSAVRIVALLLLLRICWSERPAPSPML
mmetsp:Transcript_23427/g.60983  ORF Transcript_23427/g.60983 Transcript_23427/m.60983 type:complete len:641 (+) Transcript_23427:106-2028(+)